jgi:hypothetical protein
MFGLALRAYSLVFQAVKEALTRGVVPTISLSAHRTHHVMLGKLRLIVVAGVRGCCGPIDVSPTMPVCDVTTSSGSPFAYSSQASKSSASVRDIAIQATPVTHQDRRKFG